MNEHDVLNALDRRMRAAGEELHGAIAAAIDEGSPAAATADQPWSTPEDSTPVISLDHGTSPSPSPRRWLWAAAAAVIAVGVAGVILLGRDGGDDSPPATTGDQPFLVPGWLPSGWEPVAAEHVAESSWPFETAAVYGSRSADDRWSGAFVAILRTDVTGVVDTSSGETVDVAGHSATFEDVDGTRVVTVELEGQTLLVSGRGVTRDTVLAIAAAAADDLPIEPVLPSGLDAIGEAPVDPSVGGIRVSYRSDSHAQSVTIAQRPGLESELGLIRFLLPDTYEASEATVRGQRALVLTADADIEGRDIIQWIEPPGMLVTISADGLADRELDRLIEQLRPSTDAEIDELVKTHEPQPASEVPQRVEPEEPVEIVIAEGDRGPNHWTAMARESDGLTEVSYQDEYTSIGFATAAGEVDDGLETDDDIAVEILPLEVNASEALDDRGEVAVVGVAESAITEAFVEAAGQPPLPLELYRDDKLTHTVIVGWVPPTYLDGEVVGRDSNGREVGRTTLDP
jgi:hypothetical protein